MKSLPNYSWVRLLTGVAVAFLVGEFCFPAKASAGCGDYVSFGGQSVKPKKQMRGQEHEPAQTPCHGLQCRNNQPVPPAPPTPPPARVPDFAFLLATPLYSQSESLPFWIGLDDRGRIHRTTLVYHPPRSA